eukprot:TRINITY_DN3722_c1_g1_i1.p1 TRINITY_DN3722_c1_g1~~TRINITY_DN3722_c1_g1_i1.p1  ORF type:complete len:246 (+),score=38.18 TRINITY_DN3722_c1_g1_i1:249-986(+)
MGNVTDTVKRSIKLGGLRSLYRGYGIVLMSTVPSTALYFLSVEISKKFVPGDNDAMTKQFFSGVMAQFVAGFVFTPRDVIKERVQTQDILPKHLRRYSSSFDAVKQIIKTEGILGMYKGFWQTFSMWGMYGGLYLVLYNEIKNFSRIHSYEVKGHESSRTILGSSILAAALSAALTNPLDVIKLNYQVNREKDTFYNLTKQLFKSNGPTVITRGIMARILWVCPRTAIAWSIYEYVMMFVTVYDK